jgi:hypothetical protein
MRHFELKRLVLSRCRAQTEHEAERGKTTKLKTAKPYVTLPAQETLPGKPVAIRRSDSIPTIPIKSQKRPIAQPIAKAIDKIVGNGVVLLSRCL